MKTQLNLEEDLRFQRRSWIVERVGWVIMVSIVIAGIAGLFGKGLFSQVEKSDNSLMVTYDRYLRTESPTELRIRVIGERSSSTIPVRVSKEYLSRMQIEAIVPEPERTTSDSDGLIYHLPVTQGFPTTVVFYLNPATYGRTSTVVSVGNRHIPVNQFIYP